MQLKVDREKNNEIILELKGESLSSVNLLRNELWNDKAVSEAAHVKKHPYLGEPQIFVKTERGSPRTALSKAATRIIDQTIEFKEEFKRALKK